MNVIGGYFLTEILTWGVLTVATIFGAFLAGGNLDRIVVQMPAWRKVGSIGWAVYSRHADLGNGFYLYPPLAFGGAFFSTAGLIAFMMDTTAPIMALLPIIFAVGFTISGLIFTVKAAPQMLKLRRIGDDPEAIREAFKQFDHWGSWRAIVQIGAFGTNIWSLVAVFL